MKEIFSSPEFITLVSSCLVALISALTATFMTVKARQSVKKANAYKEEAIAKLELEKVELQRTIINGSFVICPKCGEHVVLKDAEVKLKGDN